MQHFWTKNPQKSKYAKANNFKKPSNNVKESPLVYWCASRPGRCWLSADHLLRVTGAARVTAAVAHFATSRGRMSRSKPPWLWHWCTSHSWLCLALFPNVPPVVSSARLMSRRVQGAGKFFPARLRPPGRSLESNCGRVRSVRPPLQSSRSHAGKAPTSWTDSRQPNGS